MTDYEKLGVFYIGKEFDVVSGVRHDKPLLYDSKDLLTHAVIVGMTGSGKTGLGVCLIEEAAIDGIPTIVIDPKGDMANLLLMFPRLLPEDFAGWISHDEARNRQMTVEEFAAQEAAKWRNGLADWQQNGERIERLRNTTDFRIYTPGSAAANPLSIVNSFACPPRQMLEDIEFLRERIDTTVSGLLSLLGLEVNPLQSREHILLSKILEASWQQGKDLDLQALIQQMQTPPFARIGVLDLESFFPAKDRFTLAMTLNNLLAAPGFELWLQGEPLDMQSLLYTKEGKPRVAIVSVAHLNDSERMFFVTMILNEVLRWARTQQGTGSLRALLYMDEIFGYFPPVANPPSKQPLLTLLKQARAYGLGVVLATQNPVDLDYKGLSNTGTWFIGRLQTERDKGRLLDGLESVAAAASFDRNHIDGVISSLRSRIFLMRNVHEQEPVAFESRWSLSYLRGPLTRNELKILNNSLRPDTTISRPTAETPVIRRSPDTRTAAESRPVLPPAIQQYFLPVMTEGSADGEQLHYVAMLLGTAHIYYADAKAGIASEQVVRSLVPVSANMPAPEWAEGEDLLLEESDLERLPEEEATFSEVPAVAANTRSYAAWAKSFADWLARNKELRVWKSEALGQYSRPDESERDFRIRITQSARELRDVHVEKLRRKYTAKMETLQEKLRRAQQAVARETEQAQHQKLQTAISFGTTVLGALFGRKRVSTTTIGRATTAARGVGRSMKEAQDIERAQQSVQALEKQLAELEKTLESEIEHTAGQFDPLNLQLHEVKIRPKKTNIAVGTVALVWAPFWQTRGGQPSKAAWK